VNTIGYYFDGRATLDRSVWGDAPARLSIERERRVQSCTLHFGSSQIRALMSKEIRQPTLRLAYLFASTDKNIPISAPNKRGEGAEF
jgi:hypothetical protein